MSMPSFPENVLDISEEQAYNMIIASIAMEELGLSHIINAEGEKLQYILGTLPGQHGSCASTRELLDVNKSITNLLESVMQNQIVLKSKLEKVLDAKDSRVPDPPVPCPGSMRLICPPGGFLWKNDCLIPWKCACQSGRGIRWSEESPPALQLRSDGRFWLSYSFSLRASACKSGAGAIVLQSLDSPCEELQIHHFCTRAMLCHPITVSGSAALPPYREPHGFVPIAFSLRCPDDLWVEQASLGILEQ